ncbi:ubiquitin-conjugating enzyme E2 [Gimesia panareensis]|uniref:Ubiquitin-conjugating enzyme n=1 Tax=Gimesia panareensis TaxID=2527978 RepID=A0A517QDG0_9PLAN|nr:ubiquitin-conjugating enzyme E2 [Gimesia panareensis]QDT29662.1 Ubiquitin-conjugating enzyme [Gimesia panareensis]QDU52703.1 Ubiquitin-conjugating enzyme [Gimesia panareensis]
MSNVRLRRLAADYEKLKEYVRLHPRVSLLQVVGDPPEKFQLQYVIKSVRMQNQEIVPIQNHTVEISLPRNYPRTPPQCRMLTPVFHPNIAPHAICVGDHWSAGESLQSIIMRIGEILAYQSYNLKSPLNGEAARWAEENCDQFPLDRVSLLPEEEAPARPAPQTRPAPRTRQASQTKAAPQTKTAPQANPASEGYKILVCPNCEARYRLPETFDKKKVRCKKCEEIIDLSGV